ncbi:MAG: class I SAM-dependent methyltransferase [Planctomycetes bacterium]|nr:class I SAM-dependent methyltransferase [Planctomycetota bacterium]
MASSLTYEAGSYRDREGRVFYGPEGAVLRALSKTALDEWQAVAAAKFFQQAQSAGQVVRTRTADQQLWAGLASESATWAGVLEHERIPFVSYPYEWSFGMLQDAALLQLDLLRAALADDFTLKDGTIYNVQWIGTRPVFIDVVSFEKLVPGQPWAGYRQFCQTALFPLMLQAYLGIGYHPLLRGKLDGITPAECAKLFSDWSHLFHSGVLTHVWLHARLQGASAVRDCNLRSELPRAGFDKNLIAGNAAGLTKLIRRLKWNVTSHWSGYAGHNTYTSADAERKARFVKAAAAETPLKLAWDLGCNTGDYSRIVAEHAEQVVAMDYDHASVERLYQTLKAEGNSAAARKILPLVGNVADPSTGLGWRGKERKALWERGTPDLILALALIHHLVIDAGIPLQELLQWLAGLKSRLVIEFVDRHDPMVQQMLRNRRDQSADYTPELFERWLREYFDVLRQEPLESGSRTLYYARPKT